MSANDPNRDHRQDPHRWHLSDDHVAVAADVQGQRQALRSLRALRDRPMPRERALRVLAVAVTVLLHVVLILGMMRAMHPRPWVFPAPLKQNNDVLMVRLISHRATRTKAPPALKVLPERERTAMSTPPPKKKPVTKRPPPADTAAPAGDQKAPPADQTALKIYGRDGQLHVSKSALEHLHGKEKAPAYVAHSLKGNSDVMTRQTSRVKYKATRFSKDWKPDNETIVGAAVRHVIEATSEKATVNLPGHTHLHCKTVLFVLPTGCGIPPDKAPPESDDSRLNMAPAALVKGVGPKQHISAKECARIRKAGQPLPESCKKSKEAAQRFHVDDGRGS
ncbi:hypothetical protein [Oleiagrimonas sp. C23AA]|uniref:hypothetical protein n=1 Tax=Oleiagrimonas sp. C23AA TaxID=2719047 RepID=UPI00141E5A4B|nr:hypothetical protein [Oleiagrimonas sp. C23AA]NII10006.1 hypothetical protein [Oleiagrimonas sp. C23AA]